MVVTKEGEVYSFGNGRMGQLGHGDSNSQLLPKRVEGLQGRRVTQISAGRQHALALTENGRVYAWGNGEFNRTGHGCPSNQRVPKLVEAVRSKTIIEVSAGYCSSAVMTDRGKVIDFFDEDVSSDEEDGY